MTFININFNENQVISITVRFLIHRLDAALLFDDKNGSESLFKKFYFPHSVELKS